MARTRSIVPGRAGFSVLEMIISIAVLSLLAGSLGLALARMRGMTDSSNTQAVLQDSCERAMRRIFADLSRSGVVTRPGAVVEVDYPYLFEDGAAAAPRRRWCRSAVSVLGTIPRSGQRASAPRSRRA